LVGHLAKRQAVTNPENTITAVKRLIGRRWQDPLTQGLIESRSYVVCEGGAGEVMVKMHQRQYALPEISSMVLLELKEVAEAYLGERVSKAVITVPAHFNDRQRQATREAGGLAGLEVLRMINEPTSAALAYGYNKNIDKTLAVYDLGGGTFDFSVLHIADGVFEVLSTAGDTQLGGEDFDDRIILHWLVVEFAQEHRVDLRRDNMAMQRLRSAAEKAKCELSSTRSTEINLPFIISTIEGETLHLQKVLTRSKLESLTSDLVERTLEICKQGLKESGAEIDEVVLVGGMTRMPLIQERVKEFFKRAPRRDVHPDEIVSLGAAIHGTSILGGGRDVLLLDVTPMSLGIMVSGGQFSALIPKNTTIPTSKSHIFTTVRDHQTSVRILVLQGEDEDATKNELLGEFTLSDIRPAPRGEIELEVTFEIDADGIVSVSARNIETGQEQVITVTSKSSMSEADLKRIAVENEEHLVGLRERERVLHLQKKMTRTLDAMDRIMPRVETLLANNGFAEEALLKARQVITRARSTVQSDVVDDLERDAKALARTLNMFHNVVEKMRR
jgi:molecular chaperone DnaK